MLILKATKEDIKNIMDLISKTVGNMIKEGIYQWDEKYPNIDIITKDIKENSLYLLKNNDSILGIITINEEQAPEYKDINWLCENKKVLVIHRLAVNPEFQKQGIAKQLINFAEKYALENNYNSIRLDTFSENPKALKLYDNLNYTRTGKVYFSHKTSPFICFEKRIK